MVQLSRANFLTSYIRRRVHAAGDHLHLAGCPRQAGRCLGSDRTEPIADGHDRPRAQWARRAFPQGSYLTVALIWPFTTTRSKASWCSSTPPRATLSVLGVDTATGISPS